MSEHLSPLGATLGPDKSGPGAAVTARVPANDVEVADMPNGTAAVNPPHNGAR